MTNIVKLLEMMDLAKAHFFACFIGALLCVFVMQLMSTGLIKIVDECVASFWMRRASLTGLALSMCWAILYAKTKDWQPWLPDLAIICMVDIVLLSSVVVALRKYIYVNGKRKFGKDFKSTAN